MANRVNGGEKKSNAPKKKKSRVTKKTGTKKKASNKKTLSPQHKAMLKDSAITPEAIEARGYWTATRKSELAELGFKRTQQLVPALVLPLWGVHGEIVGYQARPDYPRQNHKTGKVIKYENPAESKMAIDVPPGVRRNRDDPKVDLWITEGIKKADSAVCHDMNCIDLIGVWNWRGTNSKGGRTALADWEMIALNDRIVRVVFDSDVMDKSEVRKALERFGEFLRSRSADVRYVYLKPGSNGEKVGLDDFLAAGGTVEQLIEWERKELKQPPAHIEGDAKRSHPYKEMYGGICHIKETEETTVERPLSNFTGRIVGQVFRDDGADTELRYDIKGRSGKHEVSFQIPAARYLGMKWVPEHMGAEAIVQPGQTNSDHLQAAIRYLSMDDHDDERIPSRIIYCHLGWRKIDGKMVYLHAGGAIGPMGPIPGIGVDLSEFGLEEMRLPDPTNRRLAGEAIRSALRLLDLGDDSVVFPGFCGVWRSIFPGATESLVFTGRTGGGKSTLAALFQNFWGTTFTRKNLPGNWSSTPNALETLQFAVKDALLVIDDFKPVGSAYDMQRKQKDADRVFRGQGNKSGRQRLRSDGRMRSTKYPRGMTLSTGEDVPSGQSARARGLIIEVPGDFLEFRLSKISACQDDAAAGLYAQAMAEFIWWIARDYSKRMHDFETEAKNRREELENGIGGHLRVPNVISELEAGFRIFLWFAVEVEAITATEAKEGMARARKALLAVAKAQGEWQREADDAGLFIRLLRSVFTSGAGHLVNADATEDRPESSLQWGWVRDGSRGWQPKGPRIGWVEGGNVYLDPDSTMAAVSELGRKGGQSITVGHKTLYRSLHEKGLLLTVENTQGGKRYTVRKTPGIARVRVLHLAPESIYPTENRSNRSKGEGRSTESIESASGYGDDGHGPIRSDDRSNRSTTGPGGPIQDQSGPIQNPTGPELHGAQPPTAKEDGSRRDVPRTDGTDPGVGIGPECGGGADDPLPEGMEEIE